MFDDEMEDPTLRYCFYCASQSIEVSEQRNRENVYCYDCEKSYTVLEDED